MKYRRLTIEELSELETAFTRFLAVQGIPGPDWEKIKTTDQKRVDELIDVFSDTIFEDTLSKVNFLQFTTPKEIKIFECLPEQIKLKGIMVASDSPVDFTKVTSPQMLAEQIQSSNAKVQIYTAEKPYAKERAVELFEMMENGALISDGAIYKQLEEL